MVVNRVLKKYLSALALLASSSAAIAASPALFDEGYLTPYRGWRVIADDYPKNTELDIFSFEWDYFMVHSYDHKFAGTIGYVVTNPRNRFPLLKLLPTGGNVAFIGEVNGAEPVANFEAFGVKNYSISATQRLFDGYNATNGRFAKLQPLVDQSGLHLSGKTEDFAWDLVVSPSQTVRDTLREGKSGDFPFTLAHGDDVGVFKGEEWNVDNIWPRTEFKGTVTLLKTGEVIPVEGKGYREDSFGRYVMAWADGWDFLVFSEDDPQGVSIVFQTYHRSKKMDFMDVSFLDNGQATSQRFRVDTGNLGYVHEKWQFHPKTLGCVPLDTKIVAKNDKYIIEADVDIGARQAPILHEEIIGTRIYFIQEQFPSMSGVIKRADTGEVVSRFSGQAGGEFSYLRSLAKKTDAACVTWGKQRFSAPMPE